MIRFPKLEHSYLVDFSLRRRHAPAVDIGPTSTQATSERGKARIVANSRASGGEDCREEEEELVIEGATLILTLKIDKSTIA
jgi:hypothetical protein